MLNKTNRNQALKKTEEENTKNTSLSAVALVFLQQNLEQCIVEGGAYRGKYLFQLLTNVYVLYFVTWFSIKAGHIVWPSNVFFSQWIANLHDLKYLEWPATVFQIARGSRDHNVTVNISFGIIGKIIQFWLTVNKKSRVNCSATRRNKVSKCVKLGGKNCKIGIIGLCSANHCRIFWMAFFLRVRKRFYCTKSEVFY